MVEHQVDDAPRIEGLVLRFTWSVHGYLPKRHKRHQEPIGGLNLRQVPVTALLRCNYGAHLGRHRMNATPRERYQEAGRGHVASNSAPAGRARWRSAG